jgi:hypothetical protein
LLPDTSDFAHISDAKKGRLMSSRFDVARYHKPLSVCVFGGGTLLLLAGAIFAGMRDHLWIAIGLAIAFVAAAVPVGFWFMDMFVWEPRRGGAAQNERLKQFRTAERHREERVDQRQRGVRY